MIESSNLTHAEYFHLNGQLSTERTEQLVTELEQAQSFDVREFASYAQEATAGYPSEDFMHEQVSDLHYFAKRLRGDNKQELLRIIEAIDDALQCQFNASDYGRSELHKIISVIK